MKAHEFARHLAQLARLLKRGPDFELESAHPGAIDPSGITRQAKRSRVLPKDDIPIALNALLALSSIDKKDWVELIKDVGLPIEVRSSQSTRDVLGKVLTLLESDPIARDMLTRRVRSKASRGSPELLRALSSLLK